MRPVSRRMAALLFAGAIAVPALAALLREVRTPGCARDGVAVDGLFAVEIQPPGGARLRFCSARCADAWLAAPGAPAPVTVSVRDGRTGRWVPADAATLVRSTVVASRSTGERVHAFASADDAEAHVRTYGGIVLAGADRPLGGGR